jgi:orotidine-5'-phosphate decarboxylase
MTEHHPARDRLALALDVPSGRDALALLRRLQPWFRVAKVGLELFVAEGPEIVRTMRAEGADVFVDLKFHDIPTTVHNAARFVGALGASYLTIHASGGRAMLRAGVKGFEAGAESNGHPHPVALGVTVLTSNADAPQQAFDELVAVAQAAGCPGLVCSPLDVARARERYGAATLVCPGVRPAGVGHDDQARVATPGDAVRAGADLLVVGRAVTGADDPEAAASAIADEVAAAAGPPPIGEPGPVESPSNRQS